VDDARVGRLCRALRRRRGWRQADLAAQAGCHQTTISTIERGGVASLRLAITRRVFIALGASFDGLVGWRAGDLDRLLDQRHAAVVEQVSGRIGEWGWIAVPEATYAVNGERGSIDILAGQPERRAVAVFEIKTDIPRIEEAVRRHDEKARLAPGLATGRFGWRPEMVARILVMPEDSTLRRLVARHQATFRATYPNTSRDARAWLRAPAGPMAATWFLAPKPGGGDKRELGGPRRVRRPRGDRARAQPTANAA
jgi:transcriptional regulator with XRE-family HTH domain